MTLRLYEPLRIDHITIPIADLPSRLQGTTIIQLSDLHYDQGKLPDHILEQAIAATNQLAADLIVLTGDYITDDPTPINQLTKKLTTLKSKLGIYAILGNHDYYYRHSQTYITNALTKIGIKVLSNQIAYPFGSELPLIGLGDYWSLDFKPEILNQLDPLIPRIVLSHNPDTAEILQKWRIDLQLSGHTHGGQVILPYLGVAIIWLIKFRKSIPKPWRKYIPFLKRDCEQIVKHWEWAYGLHQIGHNLLYVNRGLGTYFPGRLFCPPEVTVIKLEQKV